MVSNIFYLTHNLDLSVAYVKIKGHSNIEGNDIADRLVDEAVSKGSSVILSPSQRYATQYPIQWNQFEIDQPLRKFLVTLTTNYYNASWSLNRTLRHLFDNMAPTFQWALT